MSKFIRWSWVVTGVILFFTLINLLYHHGLPLGRDYVAYLVTAKEVVKQRDLAFNDPILATYPPFREMADGRFVSQFQPGYILYLAGFYAMGGLDLMPLANSLLLLASLVILYQVGRNLGGRRVGLTTVLLTATFYSFFWFPRRYLAENLFLSAVWGAIWLYLKAWQQKSLRWALWGYLPMLVAVFTRPEGWVYFLTYTIAVLYLAYRAKLSFFSHRKLSAVILIPYFILLPLYLHFYPANPYFLINYRFLSSLWSWLGSGKLLFLALFGTLVGFYLHRFRKVLRGLILIGLFGVGTLVAVKLGQQNWVSWQSYRPIYTLRVFQDYGLLFPFGVLALYGGWKGWWQKKLWLVLLILAPTMALFLNPAIVPDQPWYLRRFHAIVFPAIFLLAAVTVWRLRLSKKLRWLMVAGLVMLNLSSSLAIFPLRQNSNAKVFFDEFTQSLRQGDLILMYPGWYWQQWGYVLHFLYEIDTIALPKKLSLEEWRRQLENHERVFVITNEREGKLYPGFPVEAQTLVLKMELERPRLKYAFDKLPSHIVRNRGKVNLVQMEEWFQDHPPKRILNNSDTMLYLFRVDKDRL